MTKQDNINAAIARLLLQLTKGNADFRGNLDCLTMHHLTVEEEQKRADEEAIERLRKDYDIIPKAPPLQAYSQELHQQRLAMREAWLNDGTYHGPRANDDR